MIKKTMTFVWSLIVCIAGIGASCNKPTIQNFDYEALYTKQSEEYSDMKNGDVNMASYGYINKKEQGYNGWYYLMKTEEESYLSFHETFGGWKSDEVSFKADRITVKKGAVAIRRLKAEKAGEAIVFGNLKSFSKKPCSANLTMRINGETVTRAFLSASDLEGVYFEKNTTIKVGDILDFEIRGEGVDVCFNPVVCYDKEKLSLYHLTPFGKYYGDVFPWYDEENKKLYMGYLWTDDARNGEYFNALDVSDNMLSYKNIPEENNYDTWYAYKQGGRLHYLYDVNKYIDKKYVLGRDNMIYKDEENNRMLVICGCYYRFDSLAAVSDLVIYASDDVYGLSWTKPGRVVSANYNNNLPECPSLMKIGSRWYVFVSVAYNTVHQVGPLQYWTGDENVDCLDVDWQSKEFSFLDGEDLCAARPIKIKDKVYMWGWIPRTYDTMPWSPWGGYLNLPREIVQHKDGSLGGRLDPALTKILNYGNIYKIDSGNFNVVAGSADFKENTLSLSDDTRVMLTNGLKRSYVSFRADMKNSDELSYVLENSGKEYRISIVKENGNAYLKVLSPNDLKHTVNSYLKIQNCDTYDVKITVDGGIIEFFVNDEYALSAHTAMTSGDCTAYLYSAKESSISDFKISMLAPQCIF